MRDSINCCYFSNSNSTYLRMAAALAHRSGSLSHSTYPCLAQSQNERFSPRSGKMTLTSRISYRRGTAPRGPRDRLCASVLRMRRPHRWELRRERDVLEEASSDELAALPHLRCFLVALARRTIDSGRPLRAVAKTKKCGFLLDLF